MLNWTKWVSKDHKFRRCWKASLDSVLFLMCSLGANISVVVQIPLSCIRKENSRICYQKLMPEKHKAFLDAEAIADLQESRLFNGFIFTPIPVYKLQYSVKSNQKNQRVSVYSELVSHQ
nr:hypothetical protein Iba_chr12cCG19790 [Ipomoea batatas]